MRKKIVIISGGPGFGKTSIIRELGKLGYPVGDEFARDLIRQQILSDGDVLPWKNRTQFQQEVMDYRIRFYLSTIGEEFAFSDRGLPDQIAFARFRGFPPSLALRECVRKYRYHPVVFFASPWKEIYTSDEIRDESFAEACRLHQSIYETYRESGYLPVEIPKVEANKRALFILDYLAKNSAADAPS